MSFDSMVATQPIIIVLRSSSPNATTSGGLADPSAPVAQFSIQGRLVLASGTQRSIWATLGIEADYELLTQSSSVQNGDILQVTDPNYGTRTFRFMGTRGQRMGQGGIQSFTKYPVKEVTK